MKICDKNVYTLNCEAASYPGIQSQVHSISACLTRLASRLWPICRDLLLMSRQTGVTCQELDNEDRGIDQQIGIVFRPSAGGY